MIHTDGINTIANRESEPVNLADKFPAYRGEYHEFAIYEDRPGEFTLSRNGWGLGYTFKTRKRAEQALTALNNAIALDYANVSG